MDRRSYQLAAVTTVLTFALILVGEYTAVSGSGATCGLQWPDCNGQLLPLGLQVHDFVEQFHRGFAMVVGFFILGTGAVAWRGFDARDVKAGGVLAVVLLPLQVILGGTTVTFSGLVPWGYMPITQAVHHLAALAIFATLLYTTLRMRELAGVGLGRVRTAAIGGLAVLPVALVFSRNTVFAVYGTRVQLIHHALELLVFTAAVAAFVWARRHGDRRVSQAMLATGVVVTVQILIGTGVVQFSPTVQLTYYVLTAVVAALFLVAARSTPNRSVAAAS
ncbi:COX15/CtaA family protein [Halobacterium sp. R2-5]|uniref:COX15/CtaA family protein n=1 Tax=Halobacterium sp. R2-5 TaxID=2715751 RepID=UPI001422605B|nr:COX15/CtaA family protein [Halobacterium sp. R2-5]NIC00164.1 heme A synthase [Halobacterium sp. R2-5]